MSSPAFLTSLNSPVMSNMLATNYLQKRNTTLMQERVSSTSSLLRSSTKWELGKSSKIIGSVRAQPRQLNKMQKPVEVRGRNE